MLGPCPESVGHELSAPGRPTWHEEDDATTPNLTIGYVTEQMNRWRLDGEPARDWLAEEAAATRSRTARPA
jgi:hypothetical protein